jgi:uracil-DNA glycosylase
MTKEEYFKNWLKVINLKELEDVTKWCYNNYTSKPICPSYGDIFKAFNLCPYNDLKVVCIGQDPYFQRGIATGILFGNKCETSEDKLSPSLKVIKEAVIDLEVPHNCISFDNSLEGWEKQGILMINSALTVEENKPGSHNLIWRPFISSLLTRLSEINSGIIYVLFGKQAQSFEYFINQKSNTVIKSVHPAYCARYNIKLDKSLFIQINRLIKEKYNSHIEWFKQN